MSVPSRLTILRADAHSWKFGECSRRPELDPRLLKVLNIVTRGSNRVTLSEPTVVHLLGHCP